METCEPKEPWLDRVFTRRQIVVAAIAAGAISVGVWFYWRFRTIGTLVPFLATGQYYDGEIVLRTMSPDDDVLLVGLGVAQSTGLMGTEPRPSGKVFRYVPDPPRLVLDGPEGWNKWAEATGSITFRFADRDTSFAPLAYRGKILSIGGTPVATSGAHNLAIDVSPDRRFVNVLSANAPIRQGSFFWALGGGGGYPRGPFYHETFDRLTGAKVGPTYTLQYPGKRVSLSYCWEAQGNYVVYHDMHGRFLWVVPGPQTNSGK